MDQFDTKRISKRYILEKHVFPLILKFYSDDIREN